jgi:hypothetical protein
MSRACLILALFLSCPAQAAPPSPAPTVAPAVPVSLSPASPAQGNDLSSVAGKIKLNRTGTAKGSFSATESTAPQDNAGWETLYAANARDAAARLQVADALAAQAAERAAAQPHIIVQTVDPRYYLGGGTTYAHRPHVRHVPVVAPAAPSRPAAPSVTRPSASSRERSRRRD